MRANFLVHRAIKGRMRERKKKICSTPSFFETRLPVTPLGRGVALVRVTDPPTAMVMEDEGRTRMEADSADISQTTTVKQLSIIAI